MGEEDSALKSPLLLQVLEEEDKEEDEVMEFSMDFIPDTQAHGQMKERIPSSPKWLPRFLSHFRPCRAAAQGMEENAVVGPISMNAIAAAEGALRWISKVPGGDKAQVRIGGALEAIKGLTMASSHNVTTLRRLEYHVWYFAELLEPFAVMHRSDITPLLQELATASLKMKLIAAPDQAPRQKSLRTRPHEEHGSNAPDIRVFTQDVRSALDQFR
ncbi:hypothetical protein BS47DRAFT_1381836, partial [Hydnum rufescens UP504]